MLSNVLGHYFSYRPISIMDEKLQILFKINFFSSLLHYI